MPTDFMVKTVVKKSRRYFTCWWCGKIIPIASTYTLISGRCDQAGGMCRERECMSCSTAKQVTPK